MQTNKMPVPLAHVGAPAAGRSLVQQLREAARDLATWFGKAIADFNFAGPLEDPIPLPSPSLFCAKSAIYRTYTDEIRHFHFSIRKMCRIGLG